MFFAPESADLISRMALRLSVGLPPISEKEMGVEEFEGSLSEFVKHKTRSIEIIDSLHDEV